MTARGEFHLTTAGRVPTPDEVVELVRSTPGGMDLILDAVDWYRRRHAQPQGEQPAEDRPDAA